MERKIRNFLNIPDTILVGYSKEGTDSGEILGFVTYYRKSRISKESSWNSWRDKKIEPKEFENRPIKGFKINYNCGYYLNGLTYYGIGWSRREQYCFIQDPRGYSINITVSNLIEILRDSACTEGGEIEEELLYAWDGAELVLLSQKSADYIATKSMTKARIDAGITWTSLVPGVRYEIKDNDCEFYYIGHLKWKYKTGWSGYESISTSKYHTFYNATYKVLCPFTDIKQILYPVEGKPKLSDLEFNDILRKFSELPCGRPDDKINKYVLQTTPEMEAKKKRILIDRQFNKSSDYYENRITLARLSDNDRKITINTWQLSPSGQIDVIYNTSAVIQDDDTIKYTNLTSISKITDKIIQEAVEKTVPITDLEGFVMFEIGDLCYETTNYGLYTPYPYNRSSIDLK